MEVSLQGFGALADGAAGMPGESRSGEREKTVIKQS